MDDKRRLEWLRVRGFPSALMEPGLAEIRDIIDYYMNLDVAFVDCQFSAIPVVKDGAPGVEVRAILGGVEAQGEVSDDWARTAGSRLIAAADRAKEMWLAGRKVEGR